MPNGFYEQFGFSLQNRKRTASPSAEDGARRQRPRTANNTNAPEYWEQKRQEVLAQRNDIPMVPLPPAVPALRQEDAPPTRWSEMGMVEDAVPARNTLPYWKSSYGGNPFSGSGCSDFWGASSNGCEGDCALNHDRPLGIEMVADVAHVTGYHVSSARRLAYMKWIKGEAYRPTEEQFAEAKSKFGPTRQPRPGQEPPPQRQQQQAPPPSGRKPPPQKTAQAPPAKTPQPERKPRVSEVECKFFWKIGGCKKQFPPRGERRCAFKHDCAPEDLDYAITLYRRGNNFGLGDPARQWLERSKDRKVQDAMRAPSKPVRRPPPTGPQADKVKAWNSGGIAAQYDKDVKAGDERLRAERAQRHLDEQKRLDESAAKRQADLRKKTAD